MFYITGDTHGDFKRIENFCRKNNTSKEDILCILGDAGINYYENKTDIRTKEYLKELPITLFCIHGNHEQRPYAIPTYKETVWHGGIVYVEENYPSIIFAKDGEIYDFEGKKCIVIGGAYSVDKFYRIARGYRWFDNEQPSNEIKKYVEYQLDNVGWNVDYVFSHTTPYKYEPREWFISGIDQSTVDDSTERWLDTIEERLKYKKWFAGHFHGSKTVDKIKLMFEDYDQL